ncbi:IS3 family transposase [Paenibacillus alginolyticus]|uniref:IS3 family transposase n=1 Tax=Paenibacillus alginolyticus TaxID=59839 RepID=UPI000685D808|nr:IS3 family transposase [Paenibacillus alginolyticus]MCY9669525.1 IS3 family transposase [Paenibacillus alginolyticus]
MLNLTAASQVYLACGSTDMRKSIDGLAAVVHAILEKDCLSRHEFESYQDAYQIVSDYILFYNQRRIHGSLYDLSPTQFVQAIQQQNVPPLIIKV